MCLYSDIFHGKTPGIGHATTSFRYGILPTIWLCIPILNLPVIVFGAYLILAWVFDVNGIRSAEKQHRDHH